MRKTVTVEIMELREMNVPELVARYETIYGKPPRIKNREWLWKRISWKIQEERFGGLSQVAKCRLEELISEIDLPLGQDGRTIAGKLRQPGKPSEPAVGTTLVREWHGKQIRVPVLENGFEWDGTVYKSLSAVAKAITGAHWNGRLFFGLVKRKRTV